MRLGADANSWVVVSLIELDLYEALAQRLLAAALGRLLPLFEDLHAHVPAARQWASVADTAEFVLEHWSPAQKSKAEHEAAQKVLAVLRGYACQTA